MHGQNLLLRNDTFFGVCEAIGRDFGIHPNWLRIAFAVALFFSPLGVACAYVALAAVVAASRWAFPANRKSENAPVADGTRAAPEASSPSTTQGAAADDRQAEMPLAA